MANISSFPDKPGKGVPGVQGFFKGKAWAQLDEPNEETDHSAASLNSGAKMSFRWSASRMFNLSPRLTLRYSDFEFLTPVRGLKYHPEISQVRERGVL